MSQEAGPNEELARHLVLMARDICQRIARHPLYDRLAQGELPLRCVHGYLGEMVPWFRATMDRAIVRARNTPYGPVKRTWLSWACEEFGHAEMLLDVIQLMGGDSRQWGEHQPIYESEALISYMWKLAERGTYLENASGCFLGTEALLRLTLPKFGALLRDRYRAPPAAMKVFAEHEDADSGHSDYGFQIIASAEKLTPADQRRVEAALRTTLLFQERWHDGILREYGA